MPTLDDALPILQGVFGFTRFLEGQERIISRLLGGTSTLACLAVTRWALEECRSPFGDFSRGGRQRYCSPACANRDAVRRHRAKRSERSVRSEPQPR